jgi:hypothetical protein
MTEYTLKLTEDQALVLFEFFSRFDDTDRLEFVHPAEYLALMRVSAQIDKTAADMFEPELSRTAGGGARSNRSRLRRRHSWNARRLDG